MLTKSSYLVFASSITAAFATSVSRNLVLHERRDNAPNGFVMTGAAPADDVLHLRLALVNSDIAGLQDALYAVSTPGSTLYGQHLTKEQVEEYVRPRSESVSIVNEFLASHGVAASSVSPAGDWLSLSVPVHKANEMFNADFSVFEHGASKKLSVRTLAYSIPAELQGHLDFVHPTTTFQDPYAHRPAILTPLNARESAHTSSFTSRHTVPSSCNSSITPACLQSLYGIPATPATHPNNSLAVPGFINFYANHEDLAIFLHEFRPDLTNATFAVQTVNNGTNSQNASEAATEANLDVQYTVGLASGVPTTFISVGNHFEGEMLVGFLDLINFLLSEEKPPLVLSVSYAQNEDLITPAFANQLCNAIMQLGARGSSVLFGSGDGGVAGAQPVTCTNFVPSFPAGCPFITSVGGTTGIVETATNFSTGGFSNLFSMPSYQASAVNSYLEAIGSTNDGKFNRTGRAFSDVSAQSFNVEIVVDRITQTIWGTSCSGPIFASVIALLNDRLLTAGRPPLGFLNPFLYLPIGAAALNDVTTGNNEGCSTEGFPALVGWDAVTGLGTPNFAKMLAAVGL